MDASAASVQTDNAQHAFSTPDQLTLSLVAVLGSRTLLTSFVSCPTLPPTAPLLTTNDLGTFGAFGSVAAGALTCETAPGERGQRCRRRLCELRSGGRDKAAGRAERTCVRVFLRF